MPKQISNQWKRWQPLIAPEVEWRVSHGPDEWAYSLIAVPPESVEWYRAHGFLDDWNAEDELARSFVIARLPDTYPVEMAQFIIDARLAFDTRVHERYSRSFANRLSDELNRNEVYIKHRPIYDLLSRVQTPAAIWAELNLNLLQYSLREVTEAVLELFNAGLIEKKN